MDCYFSSLDHLLKAINLDSNASDGKIRKAIRARMAAAADSILPSEDEIALPEQGSNNVAPSELTLAMDLAAFESRRVASSHRVWPGSYLLPCAILALIILLPSRFIRILSMALLLFIATESRLTSEDNVSRESPAT